MTSRTPITSKASRNHIEPKSSKRRKVVKRFANPSMEVEVSGNAKPERNSALPDELLIRVFAYLHHDLDYVTTELVCKTWREVSLSNVIWEKRISRLFQGKQLNLPLRLMPKNRKSTYVFAVRDARRTYPRDLSELTEKLYSLRFLEPMGEFWQSYNPSGENSKLLLRRFLPSRKYWYPKDDPVFTNSLVSSMLPRDLFWSAWNQNGQLHFQLGEFPPMRVTRDHTNWGWIIAGRHTRYVSIGMPSGDQGDE